ncbi:MAG: transketolase C-terminal domain-containing protein, partial [Pseudodonghicola sp.]
AAALEAALAAHKARLSRDRPRIATRQASELALEVVNAVLPNSIGGSADLTGSNNTRTAGMRPVTRQDYSGDYIHYGIREHAMAAAMNGIALHGGFFAYGGTFLAFADYCRPAIRLSALMGVPVAYVMTHDSIGLGEDGPTHQPVETIASLRAMPNLAVIRPADAVETAEAWAIAATACDGPTMLCLSRQALPVLRTVHTEANMTARGAYVLREAPGGRDVTLIATGSEVEIALNAADLLARDGIRAAVVSAPCFELFAQQPAAYRLSVRGCAPRVGVEAAVRQGWELFLERGDGFVGMTGFGASGPADQLYRHFGITAEAVAASARRQITKGVPA